MPEVAAWPSTLVIVGLIAYFLGAVPFGIVWARIFGLGDLRAIGSGNIGATNVLRTGNRPAAFLTLVCDAGKGAFAVLVARLAVGEDAAQVAALTAFLGHCFPVYLDFKGGKGVATFLGTLLALAFPLGIAACLTWLVVAAIFRFSSLAALAAALAAPLWAIWLRPDAIVLCAALAVLILYRHKANIGRLMRREEPKIGKK